LKPPLRALRFHPPIGYDAPRLPTPNKLPHELFLKFPMKTSPLTLHVRIHRAVCLRAGAAILAVVLAFWLANSFTGNSRATPFEPASATNPKIVISQIFGGGGSTANSFRNDFVELFNRGTVTVSLVGWSLQYSTAFSNAWQKVELSGSIAPGQYYLIQLSAGSTGSRDLPAPDVAGSIGIDASAGKVALVKNNQFITNAPNGKCPSGESLTVIVDFVGYGGTSLCFWGTAPAPAVGNASATVRRGEGCTDSNRNNADFTVAAPYPRNSASPLAPCHGIGTERADLIITTQTSSAAVPPRGIVAFILKVLNTGPATATNILVTDVVPDGFTEITGGTVTGNSVEFPPIGSLAPGQMKTFTITARAPNVSGRYVNRAVVNSDTFDPATGNNTSLTEIAVLAGAKFDLPDVQVTITDNGLCSTSFTVETKITNTGVTTQQNNTGGEFVATLSPEIIATSCFATKGSCRMSSLVGGSSVQWDGDADVGETVTITYIVQVVGSPKSSITFCVEEKVNFDSNNDGQNESTTTVSQCAGYTPGCGDEAPTEPPIPPTSPVSDQKAGSILIFNLYTSSSVDPTGENTRINITNTSPSTGTSNAGSVSLHFFFISGDTCEVTDSFLCLTANQTTSFLMSDLDPDTTGFLIVVAVDQVTGCPINRNVLIGDEYVRLGSGHAANLAAEAFAAIADPPCACDENTVVATLSLDGIHYNQAPHILIANGIPSVSDNNSTLLVLNRIGGNLGSRPEAIGEFSGLLFDDQEHGLSFVASGSCQFRQVISSTFPRTSPRFPQFIASGHSGWIKIIAGEDAGILGSVIVHNSEKTFFANAFNGGSNLHKLTFTGSATFKVPVFSSRC
jgi:uncharacterized repeat protein (TIGR01451 family)